MSTDIDRFIILTNHGTLVVHGDEVTTDDDGVRVFHDDVLVVFVAKDHLIYVQNVDVDLRASECRPERPQLPGDPESR